MPALSSGSLLHQAGTNHKGGLSTSQNSIDPGRGCSKDPPRACVPKLNSHIIAMHFLPHPVPQQQPPPTPPEREPQRRFQRTQAAPEAVVDAD